MIQVVRKRPVSNYASPSNPATPGSNPMGYTEDTVVVHEATRAEITANGDLVLRDESGGVIVQAFGAGTWVTFWKRD